MLEKFIYSVALIPVNFAQILRFPFTKFMCLNGSNAWIPTEFTFNNKNNRRKIPRTTNMKQRSPLNS